jgi:hypothetical protein
MRLRRRDTGLQAGQSSYFLAYHSELTGV